MPLFLPLFSPGPTTEPIKMSSIQSTLIEMKAELVALRAENSEIKVLLKELTAAPAAEHSAKPKKAKKSKPESSGEPKEKRAPNAWIIFSKRIREIVNSIEGAPATKPTVANQFASSIWEKKKEWENDEILVEWECFEAPEESKQSIAGKNKVKSGSTSSAEEAEEEPEADAAGAGEKKKRKPQSEETKAAAALKRAATKAAKTATVGGSEEVDAEAEEQKPVIKKITPKPKKVTETRVIDLALDEWEYEGEKYLKNERGDVLNIDGEWYGHWDGTKINTDAAEPSDFETLAQRN
jgi:hypothetical protein